MAIADRFSLDDNVAEDVTDIIYNVEPESTPAMTLFGRRSDAQSDLIEWFRDGYRTPVKTNAYVDGQDFVAPAFPGDSQFTPPLRVKVYHQISREHWHISDRTDAVKVYGRASEKEYQEMKKGVELRRDMEEIIVDSLQGSRAGATGADGIAGGTPSADAPLTASLDTWLITNRQAAGTAGTAPALVDGLPATPQGGAPVNAAMAELDILDLKTTIHNDSDRSPTVLMLQPTLKQGLSNYLMSSDSARIATQYQDQGRSPRGGLTVAGAVDVYITDFGPVEFVPNRRMRERGNEAFLLDPEMFEISYLRGFRTMQLGKDGDSQRFMTLVDWALCCKNDESSGVIEAIDPSLAVIAGT